MKRLSDWLLLAFMLLALTFITTNLATALVIWSNVPDGLEPGMHVVELLDSSRLENGVLCQNTNEAYVMPTGIDGSPNWWDASPGFFRARTLIAIVYEDGSQDWALASDLVEFEIGKSFCSDAPFVEER